MDKENIFSIGEQKVGFTKIELILAVILSVFIYMAIWLLGTLVGFLVGIWVIIIVAPIVGMMIRKRRKSRKLWTVGISIFLSVFIGNTGKIMMMTEEPIQNLFSIFLPISIVIGGIVTGVIRYKDFLQSMKKKVIKYGFLVFAILSILFSALTCLVIYSTRLNLPSVEHLRPTKVATGWTVKYEGLQFVKTKVEYKKGKSSLSIKAGEFLTSPRTKEECRRETDNLMKGVVLASKSLSDITAKLTTEKAGEVNGHPCHIFYYDIIEKENVSEKDVIIFYFWYCDQLQINFSARAFIKNEPILEYINEVEEMAKSIKCH